MRSHRPPGRPPGGPRGRGSGPRTRSDSDTMGMSDTAMLIKSQAKADGTFLQHFHLARVCRDMMFEKQSAEAPRPSPDFGKIANVVLDHGALATLAGVALPDGGAAFAGWADRQGSDGATLKMCDNCPHPLRSLLRLHQGDLLVGIYLPVGIYLNTERRKGIEDKRKAKAR